MKKMNLEIITKRKQAKNSMNSIQYIETELKPLKNQIFLEIMERSSWRVIEMSNQTFKKTLSKT